MWIYWVENICNEPLQVDYWFIRVSLICKTPFLPNTVSLGRDMVALDSASDSIVCSIIFSLWMKRQKLLWVWKRSMMGDHGASHKIVKCSPRLFQICRHQYVLLLLGRRSLTRRVRGRNHHHLLHVDVHLRGRCHEVINIWQVSVSIWWGWKLWLIYSLPFQFTPTNKNDVLVPW